MSRRMPLCTIALLVNVLGGSSRPATAEGPPPFPREFRAVWVATVANIDWPTRPGLATAEQQREAIRILDLAAELNLNAIVLQVRPSADALYESRFEPWSAFLTGTQGKRPDPDYDPLRFWVEEAHRRGLQLHAWLNPYRARYQGARYEESPNHISKTHPELTRRYGEMLWLDPGEPEAQEHTLRVVRDVVDRYDIDGIHVDDYFYPYPILDGAKKEIDFPDDPSWGKYRASGGGLDRLDWRRQNINRLIERMYNATRGEKKSILFGISPFGIARPGQPAGVQGFDQYEKLYADVVHWLKEGWCDYCSPQLYWKIDAPGQPFRPLLQYWVGVDAKQRHIWPGLSISRIGGGARGYAPDEILGQIGIIRATPGATGAVLFSMRALLDDRGGIVSRLKEGPYRAPALIPVSPWLDRPSPGRPVVAASGRDGKVEVTVQPGPGAPPFLWSVALCRGNAWSLAVHPARTGNLVIEDAGDEPVTAVTVAAIERMGTASEPVTVTLPAPGRR